MATSKLGPLLSPESIEKIKSVMKQLEDKKVEMSEKYPSETAERLIKSIDARIKALEWFLSGDAGQLKIFKPKKAE